MTTEMLPSVKTWCEMVSEGNWDYTSIIPSIQEDIKVDWRETRTIWNQYLHQTLNGILHWENLESSKKNDFLDVILEHLSRTADRGENKDYLNSKSYFFNHHLPVNIRLVFTEGWDRDFNAMWQDHFGSRVIQKLRLRSNDTPTFYFDLCKEIAEKKSQWMLNIDCIGDIEHSPSPLGKFLTTDHYDFILNDLCNPLKLKVYSKQQQEIYYVNSNGPISRFL